MWKTADRDRVKCLFQRGIAFISLSLSLQPFIVNLIVSIGPGRKPRMTKRRSIKMNQNEAGMDVS